MLGGDFRQTLPIVRRGSTAQVLDAALHQSAVWADFKVLRLTENMRVANAQGDRARLEEFAEFVLSVGNGTANEKENKLRLKREMVFPLGTNDEPDFDGLVEWVYPSLSERCSGLHIARQRLAFSTLLCTRHQCAAAALGQTFGGLAPEPELEPRDDVSSQVRNARHDVIPHTRAY